ncbi:DUF2637 domain-containing protein [Streptomyces sp. SRF1]|uniref:DUF2637 domain-containing protein n=1 Tax=Streptomyces sp. SRF1 TaxID=1549642 RepID=UPI0025AED635|nr:DUF2637 domain-containing protein [Streptomyces sp. SRF1]MDN3053112.1 DUF2637 domain-containing protein [Streptomyces sp. SRF1]
MRLPVRLDAVLIQAVIAAALSFAHLHDLASAAGQDGWKAWAYPVSVDLLLVAAWRRLRSEASKAAGWCWFVVALAASLGANVATAGLLDLDDVPAWLRILVAGWPAVAFLGGTLLAHTAPAAEPESAPAEPESAPAVQETAGPPAEPEPEKPQLPVPHVPAALITHARRLADDHHARTGSPIDPGTLRARLNVPAPLADAIAARL